MLKESCKGLGSVSLKISNQHTQDAACSFLRSRERPNTDPDRLEGYKYYVGDLLEGTGACRAGTTRGRRGRDERRRGCGPHRWKQTHHLQANGHQLSQIRLFQQHKTASLNTPAEAGAQCVGGVIISVHTCRDESLTKNLSRSTTRLTGRPRVAKFKLVPNEFCGIVSLGLGFRYQ